MSLDNPRGPLPPSYDPKLSEPANPSASLVETIAPCIDSIRQIATDLGVRPYTVHAITVTWSGGEVGRGDPTITSDIELLPVPRVRGVGGHNRDADAAAAVERGDITVDRVSPRYTEDELEAMAGVGAPDGEEHFFETRIDERDGSTKRRRYTLARPPERRPDALEWRLTLRRYSGDRSVNGARRTERAELWR